MSKQINDRNVLSQGVFGYEEFTGFDSANGQIQPSAQDWVIYFIVNMIKSLSLQRKSLLNKNMNYINVYYQIVEIIFNVAAGEEDKDKKLIQDYSEFEEYHYGWFLDQNQELNVQLEAVQFYIRMNSISFRSMEEEDLTNQKLRSSIKNYLIDSTERINLALHLINKY